MLKEHKDQRPAGRSKSQGSGVEARGQGEMLKK